MAAPYVTSYDSETGRRYRLYAAKLRLIAVKLDDEQMITMLVGVAQDYEHMAEVFDGTDFNSAALTDYTVYTLDSSERIVHRMDLQFANDEDAVRAAKMLVGHNLLEVRSGARRVARVQP
jgi:hypothetical protein